MYQLTDQSNKTVTTVTIKEQLSLISITTHATTYDIRTKSEDVTVERLVIKTIRTVTVADSQRDESHQLCTSKVKTATTYDIRTESEDIADERLVIKTITVADSQREESHQLSTSKATEDINCR